MKQRIIGRPSKLTPEAAKEIRDAFALRETLTNKALARKHNLSDSSVTAYGFDRIKRVRQAVQA